MIDAVEELSNIAFKSEAGTCTVATDFAEHARDGFHPSQRSFADAARKGARDEGRFKDRIQSREHCVVQNPVANACFVYVTKFGVTDVEVGIRSMPVSLGYQISMECEDVALKVRFESEHVLFHTFAALELVPCPKERLGRDDAFVEMVVGFHV